MQDERLIVGDYASRGKDGGENPCVMGCAHLYLGSVFVLGEGGAGGGRIESRLAVSAVLTQFRSGIASDPRGRLLEALQHASGVLHHRSMTGQAFGRAYARCLVVLVRKGRLYAARVGNIDLGLMVGKRPLLRVFASHDDEPLLGQSPMPDVDILEQDVALAKGDRFLLTNQSLFTAVPLDEISRITSALVPAVAARRLVEIVERASDSRHVSLQIVQAGAQVAVDDTPQPTRRSSELDLAASLPDRLPATPRPSDAAAVTAESPAQTPLRPFESRAPVVSEFKVTLPPVRPTPPAQVLPHAFQGAPWAHDESGPSLMPSLDLADRDSARREPRVNLRWAGGVALVAGLAIAFSLAFPRPQRPDGEAPTPLDTSRADWLSASTDVAALATVEDVGDRSRDEAAAPSIPAEGPATLPGGAPATRSFWHQLADTLAAGTTLSGHLVTGLLGSANERADRLAEARAVVAALEEAPEPVLEAAAPEAGPALAPTSGAQDVVAAVETAVVETAAVEPTPPTAAAPATPSLFDISQPTEPPAAAPLAPAALDRAPLPKRSLARLFLGESGDAAQRVRDYVHRRHAQVDEVLGRLDVALRAVPREQALSVLSKISSTHPGPKTRKWAAAARRRLTTSE